MVLMLLRTQKLMQNSHVIFQSCRTFPSQRPTHFVDLSLLPPEFSVRRGELNINTNVLSHTSIKVSYIIMYI